MKTVGGRPRLTLHRLRSLAELQSFFHTVCHIGQSQGRGIRSHSLTPGSWQDRRVKAAGASGQSSKGSSNYEVDDEERVKNMTDREYIEHLIQLDFLETFHWNKNCIDLRLVNNMDGWLAEDFPVPSAGVPSAGFISTVIFIFSSSHTYTSLTLHWHFIDTSLTHWLSLSLSPLHEGLLTNKWLTLNVCTPLPDIWILHQRLTYYSPQGKYHWNKSLIDDNPVFVFL